MELEYRKILATILACALPFAGVSTRAADENLRASLKLPNNVMVPSDAALAIYMPASQTRERSYSSTANLWLEPGKALSDASLEVGQRLFSSAKTVNLEAAESYGLLLAISSKWALEKGDLRLEMKYRLFAPGGQKLLEGAQSQNTGANINNITTGFNTLASRTMQLVLADVLRQVKPTQSSFPAIGTMTTIDKELLVDRTKAVTSGTAFYINSTGQLMTAAHVLNDCLVVEAQQDSQKFVATAVARSNLLDLAVLDTGHPVDVSLPLRTGASMTLGEAVTNVGYPLQGVLASTPNLTRGNVSAQTGLTGSHGLFQFSAPIQPGSSGGPVVSDGGELLGVTVGTLNASAMIEAGLLPQNVNFALNAYYAAAFMRNNGIAFVEKTSEANGGMQKANSAALGAVVKLSCYQ